MIKVSKKAWFFIIFLFIFLSLAQSIAAVTEDECQQKQKNDIDQGVACWENLLGEVGQQKASLQAEVNKFNTRIALTTARIVQTIKEIRDLEKEIDSLTIKISGLDISLDELSGILVKRIAATYKKGKVDPVVLFFSSSDFSDFVGRYKYLRTIQLHDRKLLVQMETARTNYDNQKTLKEEKQEELELAKKKLESQKNLLAQQKADKENLLAITKNNEKRYQDLLAKARAELIAIKGILAGRGKEMKTGSVVEGQKIASLISGSSCNSSGTHLHFMIAQGGDTHNPFNYLNENVSYENCSGSACGSANGDSFNPSGNWVWPLDGPIKLNQGYGYTWSVQHTWVRNIYDFHNGVDISGSSLNVKAVKKGILYQGIYEGSCNLSYVRVDHDDSDLDTLYLHVNY